MVEVAPPLAPVLNTTFDAPSSTAAKPLPWDSKQLAALTA